MLSRMVVTFALLVAVACTKGKSDAGARRGTQSSLPPPPDGPCASDVECKVYLEPCSCGCIAYVGDPRPIPNDQWSTVCGGGPPGNCGVASPCMNVSAICDPTTKKCALKRQAR